MIPFTSNPHPFTIKHYNSDQEMNDPTLPLKPSQTSTTVHNGKALTPSSETEIASPTLPSISLTTPSTNPLPTRISITSTSLTHHNLAAWQSTLTKAATQHARTIAKQPENPLLPGTNKRRFTFETYQMRVPDAVLIDHIEENRRTFRREQARWVTVTMVHRVMKKMGLRQWEWSFGEPREGGSAAWNGGLLGTVCDRGREGVIDGRGGRESYAERRAKFTYTRGDDPVFKGRKFVLSRRKELMVVREDLADEVDDEEYVDDGNDETDVDLAEVREDLEDVKGMQEQHASCNGEFLFGR